MTINLILTKMGKLIDSITAARVSKAIYIFSAGILLSIAVHESSKDVWASSHNTNADLSFLVEIMKLNRDLAIGLVSGFLIGASNI